MNKLLSIIAVLSAIVLPYVAQANEGFYVGGNAGVNFLDIKSKGTEEGRAHMHTKTGYIVGAIAGYKFCNGISVEQEITYRDNGLQHLKVGSNKAQIHGHMKTLSFMDNLYYDLPVAWAVKPYVGLGIGYDTTCNKGKVKVKVAEEERENIELVVEAKYKERIKGFSWQAMTGVNYELCDGVDLNVEYKFHKGQKRAYDNALTFGAKKYF